jgi:hypothetical protein
MYPLSRRNPAQRASGLAAATACTGQWHAMVNKI